MVEISMIEILTIVIGLFNGFGLLFAAYLYFICNVGKMRLKVTTVATIAIMWSVGAISFFDGGNRQPLSNYATYMIFFQFFSMLVGHFFFGMIEMEQNPEKYERKHSDDSYAGAYSMYEIDDQPYRTPAQIADIEEQGEALINAIDYYVYGEGNPGWVSRQLEDGNTISGTFTVEDQ